MLSYGSYDAAVGCNGECVVFVMLLCVVMVVICEAIIIGVVI